MSEALRQIQERFEAGFHEGEVAERRLGAELKFPLVRPDGSAAPEKAIPTLWEYLESNGWTITYDQMTGKPVGARVAGEKNHTVASCETGYCKTEFSLAHVDNLFALREQIGQLRELLRPFAEKHGLQFLCCGIQPVTPPSKRLLMKKRRTSMWDKVFPSNKVVAPEDGDDMHMFTVNAASHVHIDASKEEAVPAVNVLNGFAGAQLHLTANSSVWRGEVDPEHRCVAERLWDWWVPAQGRSGVPERPFEDPRDYISEIVRFKPVYVTRDGAPITLKRYGSFLDYYGSEEALGEDLEGNQIAVKPKPEDIDIHNSCYWFSARVSRYFTVENRVVDQQPFESLTAPATITLGLMSALDEAEEALEAWSWDDLRAARKEACGRPEPESAESRKLNALSETLLEVAETGLKKRDQGEEAFLEPLRQRYEENTCPADEAEEVFESEGIGALVETRGL